MEYHSFALCTGFKLVEQPYERAEHDEVHAQMLLRANAAFLQVFPVNFHLFL